LDVAKINRDIVSLEGRRRVLEAQLAAVMGVPENGAIQLQAEGLALGDSPSEEDLLRRALETNQELLEAEHERRAKERRVAGEDGAKWGTLDLGAGYQVLSKSNNYDEFFNKFQRNNVSVGVQYRLPIFSSDRSARVALARSELNVADIQLKNKRQNLELQIKQQYQRVRELDAAREVARLEQRVAQDDLQVVQATMEEGRASLRDAERARMDENAKWIAFLDADYERQKAQLELLNMTGELTSLFEQRP
jgi:outer membrane protein TolC